MQLNKIRRNGKLYVRLLIGITLSIVLVLITSSLIYYFIFTRLLQNETVKTELENLGQTSNAVVNTTDIAQKVAFQIYQNSAITKMLYYTEPDPFDVQAAMLDLKSYLSTIPFIYSVYVYNPKSGRFYIESWSDQAGILNEDNLTDTNIIDILDNYQIYKPFTPIPRVIKSSSKSSEDAGVYTYLFYDAISKDRKINSAVIVNISASWINKELEKGERSGNTYLVDDHNTVLTLENLMKVKLGKADSDLIKELTLNQNSGFKVATFDNVKSLITYSAPTSYKWHYVRITPYREITEQTSIIRTKTLVIASIILLNGLLLAWLISRYLYAPINKIEKQMSVLESERRNSSYTLRQNALRKLIQIQELDPIIHLEKLRKTGVMFDFTKPYQLAYLRIDQFDQINNHNNRDILTYKFAIMNIATEICSKTYQVDAIDLEDDSILLLINILEEENAESESITVILKDIQHACMEYLRIGVTVSLSPKTKNPHDLHAIYKLAKEESNQRFFKGRRAIIEASEPHLSHKHSYSMGKEKDMVEELMAGKTKEATELFRLIMEETAESSFQVTRSVATHISVTISNLLKEIDRNGSLQLDLGTELIFPNINNYETLDEMTTAVQAYFDLIVVNVVEKRSNKQEDLTRKINDIIHECYMDPNLNLGYVSERLKKSTFYISRVYRQHTFMTIVEMISQVRMDKAKELLLGSDEPVSKIAERTGFTNSSYFHKIFKKTTGVTPAEFRRTNN